jgi:flagellar biosynthesis component FlhA
MNRFFSIDGNQSRCKKQMARAFRGCRCAAVLLILTLMLLIAGTLFTILPASHTYHNNKPQTRSPLQFIGLVLLILGCISAAAEVVLVVITIVFLRKVRTFDSKDFFNNENDSISSSLAFNNNISNQSHYNKNDFDIIQYSCDELKLTHTLSTISESSKEQQSLESIL